MTNEIRKKAQELSYVLFRISEYIQRRELSKKIEELSYQLIECIYAQKNSSAQKTIDAIIGLVALGNNIREISDQNAEIVVQEINRLGEALRRDALKQSAPDLRKHFSQIELGTDTREKEVRLLKGEQDFLTKESGYRYGSESKMAISALKGNTKEEIRNTAIRQSGNKEKRQNSIMERIKSAGSLQLREIIKEFPEISERTIRYDLNDLCSKGRLTREGNGGPGNYYALPSYESSPQPIQLSSPEPSTPAPAV